MRKYILIILSLVLLVALGLFYTQTKEQKSIKVHTEKKVPNTLPKLKQDKKPMQDVNHTKKTVSTVEEKVSTVTILKDDNTHTNLYEPLSIDEAQLTVSPRKNITPIGAMRINQVMAQLQPNDTLTLSDVEGSDYTLTVQSTQTNNDGSTSTTANYEDEGITYTTTITQSDKSTYITLSTANGLYEIESNADTGYIYKTIDIRKQLQSRTPNDVIILPIPKEK